MHLFGEFLTLGTALFLVLALGMALSFEFVNGFHDTANAVATVIYTHSLRPWIAVIWSGLWNLLGVLTSTGAVAFGVVALLPVELVLNVGSGAGFAMVFALLLSAIIWNLGTWYLGLPASSSHTLIGAIMGVGLANSMLTPGHVFGEGVNWAKAEEVFSSLLFSPIVGFVGSAILLLLAKGLIRRPELFEPPAKDTPPPWPVRLLLICTCTGVSFAHGSNDGQKGMGLIMLILVGIVPATFALNLTTDPAVFTGFSEAAHHAVETIDRLAGGNKMPDNDASTELSNYLKTTGQFNDRIVPALSVINHRVVSMIDGKHGFRELSSPDRSKMRSDIYLVGETINKLNKQGHLNDPQAKSVLTGYRSRIKSVTDYIPVWVKVAVACALGFGTMIGWKRIVVTVGEKIGKSHLTYGQGASAELVAMATILAADRFGLPVSTTHVLSSGVAGTMAANRSGLQMQTLRNIVLAWVLTLPACVLLGAATFAGGLYIVFNLFGMK
ncbi:MAG: inorganic phosphate transporter [Verrucomicrobia bacterium]|nr:inorganic phosphate transporter [Verrucomicrobiota bacterium]